MPEICGGCTIYFRDYLDVLKSREKLLKFLISHGCMMESVRCTQCHRVVPLNTETLCYTCFAHLGYTSQKKQKRKRIRCTFYLSARRGTLFENASLSVEKICEFVLFWLMMPCTQQTFLREQLGVGSNTACKWSSYCRDVCTSWVERNTRLLGGDGGTVEIDVTKIWKKKCTENSSAEAKWMLGGYERESGDVFVVQVEKQDEVTLLKVIMERVLPNTTIITDCQYAFQSLESEGYVLETVSPTESYKGSESEAHINHILCFWRQVRECVPKFGYRVENCEGYLGEFLFKRKISDSRQRLHAFWTAAAELCVPVAAQKEYAVS